jgi:hypothetical protein
MSRLPAVGGRLVLVILTASIALWAVMIFGTLAHLHQMAGGLDPFDVRPFGYDVAQARALLEALGDEGRDFYARVQLRFDTFYPASYALARALVLWWATADGRLRKATIPIIARVLLVCPALAAAGFDYAENALIGRMLAAGPSVDPAIVEAASRMTVVKSLLVSVNETLVIIVVVLAALRWRRHPQR